MRVALACLPAEALDVLAVMCTSHNWVSLRLDGSCSVKQRQALVDTFNDPQVNLGAKLARQLVQPGLLQPLVAPAVATMGMHCQTERLYQASILIAGVKSVQLACRHVQNTQLQLPPSCPYCWLLYLHFVCVRVALVMPAIPLLPSAWSLDRCFAENSAVPLSQFRVYGVQHPSFVLLLSSKAGGVGLNIIGANRLVLFDPGVCAHALHWQTLW